MSEIADAIVDAVLRDLMGRRSVKVPLIELEDQDPEMFACMKVELADRVEAVLHDEDRRE